MRPPTFIVRCVSFGDVIRTWLAERRRFGTRGQGCLGLARREGFTAGARGVLLVGKVLKDHGGKRGRGCSERPHRLVELPPRRFSPGSSRWRVLVSCDALPAFQRVLLAVIVMDAVVAGLWSWTPELARQDAVGVPVAFRRSERVGCPKSTSWMLLAS